MSRVAAKDSFAATRLNRTTNELHGLRPWLRANAATRLKPNTSVCNAPFQSISISSRRTRETKFSQLDGGHVRCAAKPRSKRSRPRAYGFSVFQCFDVRLSEPQRLHRISNLAVAHDECSVACHSGHDSVS